MNLSSPVLNLKHIMWVGEARRGWATGAFVRGGQGTVSIMGWSGQTDTSNQVSSRFAATGLRIAICSPRGMSRSPRGIQRVRCGLGGPGPGEGAIVSESMVGISVFMNLSSPVLNLKHIMVKASGTFGGRGRRASDGGTPKGASVVSRSCTGFTTALT